MSQDAPAQEPTKTYNIVGMATGLVVRDMRKGGHWALFRLTREDKRPLQCVAFAEKADAIVALGDAFMLHPVKVFGFYDEHTWTDGEGSKHRATRFKVLSCSFKVDDENAEATPAARRPARRRFHDPAAVAETMFIDAAAVQTG